MHERRQSRARITMASRSFVSISNGAFCITPVRCPVPTPLLRVSARYAQQRSLSRLILRTPTMPLSTVHRAISSLGARRQLRKKKISLHDWRLRKITQ